MKVLIVGLGSIAKKHISALRKIDSSVVLYALRSQENAITFPDVENVYDWSIASEVDFILISNPTSAHAETIIKASEFNKPLFIEKPILGDLERASEIVEIIQKRQIPTYVAFVLRFHPILLKIKEYLSQSKSKIDEVNIYCGSYLPEWRQGVDFRNSYSANAELGGGVHLDMTHEIDYAYWLFGKPKEVKSLLRSKSHLQISAIDYASYQFVYEGFTVNIILNYYRRQEKREIEILSKDFILNGDLINYKLRESLSQELLYEGKSDSIKLLENQMRYFIKNLNSKKVFESNVVSSVNLLKLILLRNEE